mmetsp:Transcript_13028/g.24245  ORF Transcript_13028/g.24245 Transcript_13028/m.24245 type:complete len:504 (+) Transcript_13028:1953-3464(+)
MDFQQTVRAAVIMDALKRVAMAVKDRITGSEIERNLNEATSNENWGVSNTTLTRIAEASFNYDDGELIMRHVWRTISSDPKEWRRIYKTLTLLEHLLKFGSSRCVQQAKDELFQLRLLTSFSYSDRGEERGTGIRDKARVLVELLSDFRKLDDEREKARTAKEKYVGISSDQYRGGFGADSFRNDQSRGGFGPDSYRSDYQRGGASADRYSSQPYNPSQHSTYTGPSRSYDPAPPRAEPEVRQEPVVAPMPAPARTQPSHDLFAVPKLSPPTADKKPKHVQPQQQDLLSLETKQTQPSGEIFVAFEVPKAQPKHDLGGVFTVPDKQPSTNPFFPEVAKTPSQPQPAPPKHAGIDLKGLYAQPTPAPQAYPGPPSHNPYYPQVQTPQYPGYEQPQHYPQYPPQHNYPPQYPGYSQPPRAAPPQPTVSVTPTPTYKISHNMDSYNGPSLSELKSCPTLHSEFSEFQSASEPPKSKDWESSLVNLDDLGQESKPKSKDQPVFGVFF